MNEAAALSGVFAPGSVAVSMLCTRRGGALDMSEGVVREVRNELALLADEKYRKFSAGLLPGTENILGVRLPVLRKIAKRLARGDWQAYVESEDRESFEEIMLHGMILGYVQIDFELLKVYISKFVPWIDNWSVCDSFCSGLKIFRDHLEEGWVFLESYARSEKEYEARFAMVMYLNYYVNSKQTSCGSPADVDRILEKVVNMNADGYYAQMAAAWLLAECYVNSSNKILSMLKAQTLNTFIHNKTISKICESYKVPAEDKPTLKALRRKENI